MTIRRCGADLTALDEELRAAGAYVFSRGLQAPDAALTFYAPLTGAVFEKPGPAGPTTLAGMWIIDCASEAEAREWARRCAAAHRCDVELRPFQPLVSEYIEESHVRDAEDAVAEAFRLERGRAVATLVRMLGNIDAAEEAVQDAFVRALEVWPRDGIPPSPAGWIVTTAKNRSIDVIRREGSRQSRYEGAARLAGDGTEPDPAQEVADRMDDAVQDDQLRLMFTCCHPALGLESQVALTLRLIAGLETRDIARAFLTPEPTMAQRLTRAKRKIAAAKIPYRVPTAEELPERVGPVLSVLYLVFNNGYGEARTDIPDMSREAIRLTRSTVALLPDELEARGLLALMLLTEARRPARFGPDGEIVLLADQDRSTWDADLAREGRGIIAECMVKRNAGPYQLQAAIAAVHSMAPSLERTAWDQILSLYDALFAQQPTAVVELNRAVVVAEVSGPEHVRCRSLTASRSSGTTCGTRPAPTCSVALAVTTRRAPRI